VTSLKPTINEHSVQTFLHFLEQDALFPAAQAATSNPAEWKGYPDLKKGDQSQYVAILQEKLGLSKTQKFDDETEAAVKSFQSKNTLVSTGVVDKATWRKLFGGTSAGDVVKSLAEGLSTVFARSSDLTRCSAPSPAPSSSPPVVYQSAASSQKKSGFPWAWVVGGVGVVGVLGLTLFLVTRD